MNSTRRAVIVALVVAALAVGALYAKHWVAIDRCLDNGGQWDYQSSECKGSTP